MKKLSFVALALLLLLSACGTYIYGVPQERWDRMSEAERIEAMRLYEREQEARRIAAEERARRQAAEEQARRIAAEEQARRDALERQREQARQAALERERLERIERIHRGDGAYGQLIRVRLQGGTARIGDRLYRYEPLTFTIAEGETRRIAVSDHKGRSAELNVAYGGGSLSLEGVRFGYDRSWGRGRLYSRTTIPGTPELHDIDLFIEVHDRSSRSEREQHRLVLYRDPEPAPVVREREHPKPPPPPVVVKEKDYGKQLPGKPVLTPPVAERPPRSLEIVLLSGEMKVRGRVHQLERVVLRMADGENREMVLKAGGESQTVLLSYRNGELFVDGTPGKGKDGVRLPYEKEWRSGRTYRIDLKGKGHLEKLELKVTGAGN